MQKFLFSHLVRIQLNVVNTYLNSTYYHLKYIVFSFLGKNSHQKFSSFIPIVKNKNNNNKNNKASKYTQELIFTVRRSGLKGAISFKWTYHIKS